MYFTLTSTSQLGPALFQVLIATCAGDSCLGYADLRGHTPTQSQWSLLKETRNGEGGRCEPTFSNSLLYVSFECFTLGMYFILTLQFFLKAITGGKIYFSE